ncbi:MAG: hypothetical protein V2A74_13665 [bacterium]
MPDFEELIIRITKNGDIIVEMPGMAPRRVQQIRELMEEAIGPVKDQLDLSADPAPPAGVWIKEDEEEKQKRRLES